jgi:hypothetical protein
VSSPLAFLKVFAGQLRQANIRFAITSGMACVHYGLQQTTKDSDWIIAPEDLTKLRGLFARLEEQQPPWRISYRSIFGAPLEAEYLGHGWTSHLLVTDAERMEHKVDIFGKPPRVQILENEPGDPDYASRHVVAMMKRTDRDRDWPVVFGCGVQMLERNDSRGVLHLQEADWLSRAWEAVPVPLRLELQRLRPLLSVVDEQPARLRRLMAIERGLWEAVNRTRYRPFKRAAKEFFRKWLKEPGMVWPSTVSFAAQHEVLRGACQRHQLPINPLSGKTSELLLAEAQKDAAEALATSPEEFEQITPPIEVLYP